MQIFIYWTLYYIILFWWMTTLAEEKSYRWFKDITIHPQCDWLNENHICQKCREKNTFLLFPFLFLPRWSHFSFFFFSPSPTRRTAWSTPLRRIIMCMLVFRSTLFLDWFYCLFIVARSLERSWSILVLNPILNQGRFSSGSNLWKINVFGTVESFEV